MGPWSVGGTTIFFRLGGVALFFYKTVPQTILGIVSRYRFELRVPTRGAHRYYMEVSMSCIRPLNSKWSLRYLEKCINNKRFEVQNR